ncbi:MAG: hypothetical protein PHN31_02585 [Candidatus Gracilibacteria bacterium]|nr:hypothetical protein [Candidatus Gracilibacteria bacterium]
MNINKKGFSILEVVVASMILSLSVFGIYKLIAENNKIINNSNNFFDANILITNMIDCIEGIGFDTLKSSSFLTNTGSFYFENSLTGKCITGNYNTSFTFTGNNINNINYYLYGKITNSTVDTLDWTLGVYGESVGVIEKEWKMMR